jgi:putative ABC transport system substrate-binding protein
MLQMRRRETLIGLAGALLMPRPSRAQSGGKMYRIGHLDAAPRADMDRLIAPFYPELAKLGFVEGRDFTLDRRTADGQLDRLPRLAAEIVAGKPDLIFAPPAPATAAAKAATSTIPIVFCFVNDPVGLGLVKTLAKPGGNLTGFSNSSVDVAGKRLQLLKEAVPAIRRLAAWFNPETANDPFELRALEEAAGALGLELQAFPAGTPTDFEKAAQLTKEWSADAVCSTPNPAAFTNRRLIIDLIAVLKMPAIYWNAEFVEAGGLMSYAADFQDIARRAAHYAAKILQGARPADLPVEQPSVFELVVNLRTARSLGLALQQPFLLRADRVLE